MHTIANKRMTALALALAFALITGCGRPAAESDAREPAPAPGAPADGAGSPAAEPEPVPFEDVDMSSLSGDLAAWVEEKRQRAGAYLRPGEGGTYLLVALGERSTGGYDIRVTQILREQGQVKVRTLTSAPAGGDMVTQAITYPAHLVWIPGGIEGLPVQVEIGDLLVTVDPAP